MMPNALSVLSKLARDDHSDALRLHVPALGVGILKSEIPLRTHNTRHCIFMALRIDGPDGKEWDGYRGKRQTTTTDSMNYGSVHWEESLLVTLRCLIGRKTSVNLGNYPVINR